MGLAHMVDQGQEALVVFLYNTNTGTILTYAYTINRFYWYL